MRRGRGRKKDIHLKPFKTIKTLNIAIKKTKIESIHHILSWLNLIYQLILSYFFFTVFHLRTDTNEANQLRQMIFIQGTFEPKSVK